MTFLIRSFAALMMAVCLLASPTAHANDASAFDAYTSYMSEKASADFNTDDDKFVRVRLFDSGDTLPLQDDNFFATTLTHPSVCGFVADVVERRIGVMQAYPEKHFDKKYARHSWRAELYQNAVEQNACESVINSLDRLDRLERNGTFRTKATDYLAMASF